MKLLGVFLLFLCSSSIGVYLAFKSRKKVSDLKELINFLKHVRTRIVYFNAPLNTIYSGYTADSQGFREFLKSLKTAEMYDILNDSPPLSLSKNSMDALKEMSKELGKTFKDKQTAMLDNCINLLEKEYTETNAKAPQTYKLYISLGIYIGILLVILFL